MKLEQYVADTDPERHGKGKVGEFIRKIIGFSGDHNVVIQKFGRYPHRNAVLGRESTPEEIEHM